MTALGIEWGSSATTLAGWSAGGQPEPLGLRAGALDVPSAVTVRGDRVCLGSPANPVLEDRTVTVRDLHQALQHGRPSVAGLRVDDLIGDFFALLLLQDGAGAADGRLVGATGAVVAVPHRWFTAAVPAGPGVRERLRRILVDRCRIPVRHVVSAPVAAMAYLAADRSTGTRLAADAGPVVVCDVGEWSCEATLLRIDEDAVRPLAGRSSTDHARPFSTVLDRAIADALCRRPDAPQSWRDDPEALRAAVRAGRQEQHARARDLLRGNPRGPVPGDTEVFRVMGQAVTADVVTFACSALAVEIAQLVEQVVIAAAAGTEALQVVLIGALAELAPLPLTLAELLRTQLGSRVVVVEPTEPARAVCYGAAALAAGLSAVDELLEPGLDVAVYGIEDGRLRNFWLPAAPPNTMRTGTAVEVRTTSGRPLTVLVDDRVAQIDLRLHYTVAPERELAVPLAPAPPPGSYRMSFQLTPTELTLVLRGADGAGPLRYPVLTGSAHQEVWS